MKKVNVVSLATCILNKEIEERDLGSSMFVGDFVDELVFVMIENDQWYMYRIGNTECKKFFKNPCYKGGESFLDKVIRKAKEV